MDIYLPLDAWEAPNKTVWPVAMQQLEELVAVIEKCGWVPSVLNPEHPVSSVSEGIDVVRRARSERFINFIERDGRNCVSFYCSLGVENLESPGGMLLLTMMRK